MSKKHVGFAILVHFIGIVFLSRLVISLVSNEWALFFISSRAVILIGSIVIGYGLIYYFLALPRQSQVKAPIPATLGDPFAERDEIDAGLLAANSFIRAGRYTEARAILEPIKSDPKAAEWLKKLSDPKYK